MVVRCSVLQTAQNMFYQLFEDKVNVHLVHEFAYNMHFTFSKPFRAMSDLLLYF